MQLDNAERRPELQGETPTREGFMTSRPSESSYEDLHKKENVSEMKNKLQSIQTGKAYLEKKIQEYESRLSQMKIKKEKTAK